MSRGIGIGIIRIGINGDHLLYLSDIARILKGFKHTVPRSAGCGVGIILVLFKIIQIILLGRLVDILIFIAVSITAIINHYRLFIRARDLHGSVVRQGDQVRVPDSVRIGNGVFVAARNARKAGAENMLRYLFVVQVGYRYGHGAVAVLWYHQRFGCIERIGVRSDILSKVLYLIQIFVLIFIIKEGYYVILEFFRLLSLGVGVA